MNHYVYVFRSLLSKALLLRFNSVRVSCNTVEELRYGCAIIATYTKEKVYNVSLAHMLLSNIANTILNRKAKKISSFLYSL